MWILQKHKTKNTKQILSFLLSVNEKNLPTTTGGQAPMYPSLAATLPIVRTRGFMVVKSVLNVDCMTTDQMAVERSGRKREF